MEHVRLKSDNLYSTGYDPKDRRLEIRFARDLTLYEYYFVPERIYRGLVNAPSPGTYFDENIRGCYGYQKIEEKTLASEELHHERQRDKQKEDRKE